MPAVGARRSAGPPHKTAPGLRALDKYAVATAGASNHRLDLAAMVLLKENHIAVAGGVGAAVAAIRAHNACRRPSSRPG
ncbi:hypothetical protein [Streptomyces sp. NPDC050416]|uniref:hypothetical protein n=1 Tax=Streptomyces sp. NPDC050416 TaxID=3365611 RepID=UPI0037B35FD8